MVRVERKKDGEVAIYVNGSVIQLPPPGNAIVLVPDTKYKWHTEATKT